MDVVGCPGGGYQEVGRLSLLEGQKAGEEYMITKTARSCPILPVLPQVGHSYFRSFILNKPENAKS